MEFDPEALSARDRYGLMIATILPRPIAWVSTISPEGVPNLAPFSFFTGITANPMSVCFAPANNRDGVPKDTLLNARATKQFVVNLATEGNAEKMNQTAANHPYGVSEFKKAGLTPIPSAKVKPPRVKESPVHMECAVLQIVTLSEGPLGGHLVIGRVVCLSIADDLWNAGRPRHQDLKAIGRMEGCWYTRTQDAFELPHPEVEQTLAPKLKETP